MRRRSALFLLTLVLLATSPVFAQEGDMTRTFGLAASLQGGQGAVTVPLWMGDTLVLAPGVSLNWIDGVTTNIGLFVQPRYYTNMRRVAPYLTGQLGVMLNMPNGGGDTTNLQLAGGLGAEYFINPKFSLAIEALLQGFVADISGASNKTIVTVTVIQGNIYF